MKILRLFVLAAILPLMGCPGDDDDTKETGEDSGTDSGTAQVEMVPMDRRA